MSWRDHIRIPLRSMSAYHVPPETFDVKLDANESPWPLTPELEHVIALATANQALHRYPDAGARELKAALATHAGVPISSLVIGNGSDEIIAMLCAAFGNADVRGPARVMFSSPGFVMYSISSVSFGLRPVEVPLGPGYAADPDALVAAIEREQPSVVFLATPNNPTGTVWPRAAIERVLAAATDSVVVIDEAYLAYSGEPSCVDLALKPGNERCVVMQTLSKIGLAGLRVGYLVGQGEMVRELEKVRPPYNLDTLAQAAATAVLRHGAEALAQHAKSVRAERARLAEALAARPDYVVYDSGANFVLVRVPSATALSAQLRQASIAVRAYDRGLLADCVRITVGTPAENDRLLAALATL